ncbi:transcriptional regulator [Murinocardiopsis flavida]|uniref:Transcriptional regulator n=1 Tax=Murinocardiopsis flavida TaxID=645275 RepID=A0A2P8DEC8_9ACTN|nr:MerR family transcriptional regulator [Murinocardiopsis flavida]PSK95581.1 transcriptional regulator [Murinocardiopsis flavida]
MRISELSRRSGVSVATIKYYLREGLVPKGEATGATQARYGEAHLHRLRLIRALVEVGDAPLAKVHAITAALDSADGGDLHRLLGITMYALAPEPHRPAEGDPAWTAAQEEADALIAELGWRVTRSSPARGRLAAALAATDRIGRPVSTRILRSYARAAEIAAEDDLTVIDPDAPRDQTLEHVVIVTARLEQALAALHRLAQEDASARSFGRPRPGAGA